MLTTLNAESSTLKKVITGDESWVYNPNHLNGMIKNKSKHDFKSLSRIEKNAGISVLYLRGGCFKGDKIFIDK